MDFINDPWAPLVRAIIDYEQGDKDAIIVVHDDFGDRDEWDAGYFFRQKEGMPAAEQKALELCRGTVLDIGAGAGCHSLALQAEGLLVTALEPDPDLAALMSRRGVESVVTAALDDENLERFDTVLLMMNGLGLAATREGLGPLLDRLQQIVAPGGQVLADSTDMRPFLDGVDREDGRYLGEVTFQFEYKGVKGKPFPYLYPAQDLLAQTGRDCGWGVEIILQDSLAFLARLTSAV